MLNGHHGHLAQGTSDDGNAIVDCHLFPTYSAGERKCFPAQVEALCAVCA